MILPHLFNEKLRVSFEYSFIFQHHAVDDNEPQEEFSWTDDLHTKKEDETKFYVNKKTVINILHMLKAKKIIFVIKKTRSKSSDCSTQTREDLEDTFFL